MADIKTMFSNISNGTGAGPSASQPAKKAATIEEIYQKKSQYEHILLRPDTYVGSIEKLTEEMWIYDREKEMMVKKEITYVPGLYKIFDEILVNAADNKQRDKRMDCIKIEIKPDENLISVWNNGQGIPVQMHKGEKMYVPTMIFGHLLTSSNYNDDEEKVTGGRNGYGAKLCNIFSEKFIVETASKQAKKRFKQTWAANMTKTSEPKIQEFSGDDFTKVTFSPDLAKFKMQRLDDDIVALMTRRAYDVAASTRGVKVVLNGSTLPIKAFKDYVNLYIKDKKDDRGEDLKIVYEQAGERWEVAITLSDGTFNQMSFVNSIATTKGGRHVDHVVDMIIKYLMELFKKKHKNSTVKPAQIKNRIWVFINCLIVNPNFDSQTKENMTLQVKSFGSKCTLTDKFFKSVAKVGIVEAVLSWITYQQEQKADKGPTKKVRRLRGITKLEEAVKAGGPESHKCTLILTEGDSAKTLVMSGLGVIGRDYYGVYPLRGKLLNVREASKKQENDNTEIQDLIKIVGLQYFKKYDSADSVKQLRYGKIMIMTDQDQDGSHIKGLLINFIHYHWPQLLQRNFLEEFITPIVKATKKKEKLSFYSMPEFEEWRKNTPNQHTYQIKYYKGLGTSTSIEAKEYFSDMARHRIPFRYNGPEDDDHIVLAFSKKHVDARKEWLTNFMADSKRRKELGMPDRYLYTKDTKFVNYKDFVNLELVLFSNADNVRSIPSLVDGFKPGQRKVLYTCFKRNDKREVKVAQLAGSVAEHSAYHHGEMSLCMTIVNLAQNYVGSNNINLLEPRGQFGTRLSGGKDSASARYIFTKLSPLARMIFHPFDDSLLKHEYDDNLKIEPVWYIPIIPMVLVNGAEGIGTGWMTKILNYNPRDIVKCIRNMLDGKEPEELVPWYKNFKGTVEFCGEGRYCISGEIAIIGPNTVEITELPIGTWTQNYKENVLEPMVNGSPKMKSVLHDYKEYNTDTIIKFIVQLQNGQMEILEREGLHKAFKLQTIANTSSMCCFDEYGSLKKFDNVMDIFHEFYPLRLKMYQKRKDYLEGMLESEAKKLSNQARFIMEKCNGKLTVENKKRKVIIAELQNKGYDIDPVLEWKERVSDGNDDDAEATQDEEEEQADDDEDEGSSRKKTGDKNVKSLTESKKFDYLLGMSMWMLTEEKKNELLKQRDDKLNELEILRKKSNSDLWREDLDAFSIKLDEVEEKERKAEAEAGIGKTAKKEGKKKLKLAEILPSPMAKRVIPMVTEEIKKKIQAAVKMKENKIKKGMKKEALNGSEEVDEFDVMVKNQKTLKEKLGTPEDLEKNVKKKKGADGLKQTKLQFKKKSPTDDVSKPKRGKGRKKDFSDSGDDDDFNDNSFDDVDLPVIKERTNAKRAATKVKKYNFFEDDEDSEMDDADEELIDNDFLKNNEHKAEQILITDSDEEQQQQSQPSPQLNSSEDLFDRLVGTNKKVEENGAKRKLLSSDDEAKPKTKEKAKKPRAKKLKTYSSDSDDNGKMTNKKAASKNKKKKTVSESGDDELPLKKPPARARQGRAAATKAYVFDSDSE